MTKQQWIFLGVAVYCALVLLLVFLWPEIRKGIRKAEQALDEGRELFDRPLERWVRESWASARNLLNSARTKVPEGSEEHTLGQVLTVGILIGLFWLVAAVADAALTIYRFDLVLNYEQPWWLPNPAVLGSVVFIATVFVYGGLFWDSLVERTIFFFEYSKKLRKNVAWLCALGFLLTIVAGVLLAYDSTVASSSTNQTSAADIGLWMLLLITVLGATALGHNAIVKFGHVVGAFLFAVVSGFCLLLRGLVRLIWGVLRFVVAVIRVICRYVLGWLRIILERVSPSRFRQEDGSDIARPVVRLVARVEGSGVGSTNAMGKPEGGVFESDRGLPASVTMDAPHFGSTFEPEDDRQRLWAYWAVIKNDEDEILWDSGEQLVDNLPRAGQEFTVLYTPNESRREPLPRGVKLAAQIKVQQVPSGTWSQYSEPLEFVMFSPPGVSVQASPGEDKKVILDLFYIQAEDQPLTNYRLRFNPVDDPSKTTYEGEAQTVGTLAIGKLTTGAPLGEKHFQCNKNMGQGLMRIGDENGEVVEVTNAYGADPGPYTHNLKQPLTRDHRQDSMVTRAIITPEIPLERVLGGYDVVVCKATFTSAPKKPESAPFQAETGCDVAPSTEDVLPPADTGVQKPAEVAVGVAGNGSAPPAHDVTANGSKSAETRIEEPVLSNFEPDEDNPVNASDAPEPRGANLEDDDEENVIQFKKLG